MSDSEEPYRKIADHYEGCFDKHGPTHLGVDWPNQHDLHKRYRVMLDLIPENKFPCSFLDFGCGAGLMAGWLKKEELLHLLDYYGCDISQKFVDHCKEKFKETVEEFFLLDATKNPEQLPTFDYIIMNGVFTMKVGLSQEQMWDHFCQLISIVFSKATKGIAFNLMSKQVDWERDDLFHVSLDQLAFFLTKQLSRHFVIRNDYGLYEYTVYLYKEALIK